MYNLLQAAQTELRSHDKSLLLTGVAGLPKRGMLTVKDEEKLIELKTDEPNRCECLGMITPLANSKNYGIYVGHKDAKLAERETEILCNILTRCVAELQQNQAGAPGFLCDFYAIEKHGYALIQLSSDKPFNTPADLLSNKVFLAVNAVLDRMTQGSWWKEGADGNMSLSFDGKKDVSLAIDVVDYFLSYFEKNEEKKGQIQIQVVRKDDQPVGIKLIGDKETVQKFLQSMEQASPTAHSLPTVVRSLKEISAQKYRQTHTYTPSKELVPQEVLEALHLPVSQVIASFAGQSS